jgi:hypothetical protein
MLSVAPLRRVRSPAREPMSRSDSERTMHTMIVDTMLHQANIRS